MFSVDIVNRKIRELEYDPRFKKFKCYPELYAFLCSDRHKHCYLCEKAQSFMYTKRVISLDGNDNNGVPNRYGTVVNTKLKGLKPILKKVFWPDYKYVKQKYHYGTGVTSTNEGIERGTKVHEQLCDYVNLTPKKFEAIHPILHSYTKKAIIWMKDNNILPIIAELILYDEYSYYGTAADLIAIEETTGQLLYIEWKSGGDHYKNTGTSPLRGCLGKLYSDTPQNQAFLQALMTMELMSIRYNLTNITGCVAYIDQSGVEPKKIPEDMLSMREDVSDEFYRFLNENNTTIKKIKSRSKKTEKMLEKLKGIKKPKKRNTKQDDTPSTDKKPVSEKQKKSPPNKAKPSKLSVVNIEINFDDDEPDDNTTSPTKYDKLNKENTEKHKKEVHKEGEGDGDYDSDDVLLPILGISH